MSDEELNEADLISDENVKIKVLPAFEYIKKNILYSWFRIEDEYRKYVFLSSLGKKYRIEQLTSKIITLYSSILRPMMKDIAEKRKDENLKNLVQEMDSYIKNNFEISEDKINHIIEEFSNFLHDIKLTDISFEVKPWEERFRESYGVF